MNHTCPSGKSTAAVRALFTVVARRYDFLNRLMSLGQDQRWRRAAVRRLKPPDQGWLLDAGTGTGDLATALKRQAPRARVVGCDLTPAMIAQAKHRTGGESIHWVIADAYFLPFAQDQFDCIASAFLLRNTSDPVVTFAEQRRVLQPHGRMACLETTPPPRGLFGWPLRFYLRRIIPLLGKLFAGNPGAYSYLRDSTETFQSADELTRSLEQAGFTRISWSKRMFGAVAIHVAHKIGSD